MTIPTRTRLRLLLAVVGLAAIVGIGIAMSATPPTNEGEVQPRVRRFQSMPGLYIPHNLDDVNVGAGGSPVLFSGTGAPAAAVEEGSFYMRSDGAVDTTLYLRASGAWSAVEGVGGGLPLLDSECLAVGTDAAAPVCHDGVTGVDFSLCDNDAGALRILQGANAYIVVSTANGAERVGIVQIVDYDAASIDWSTQAVANTLVDNSATGMTWASGGATWLTLDTTDGVEGIESTAYLTTTDGVAAGTVRSVGGRAYSNTAASTPITGATEVPANFDTSYSLPANSLRAGSVISIHAAGVHTVSGAAETHDVRLLVGGYEVTDVTGVNPAANDVFVFHFDCVVRTIGAGGTMMCDGATSIGAIGTATRIARGAPSAAFNTTIANTIAVELDYQAGQPDPDSAQLEMLVVEIR